MLISIIVPVYNTAFFLDKCLNSLVNQTYKEIEIIVVNDGSTDCSQDIINKYVKKHRNIKSYYQVNSGVSVARNFGLKRSEGEYILFVDSDDWLDLNYVEKCVTFLKENKVDLLLAPYIREYKSKSVKNYIFSKNKYFSNKEEIRKILLRKLFGPIGKELRRPAYIDDLSPSCCKLYSSKICRNKKFEDISQIGAEDIWFNINCIYEMNRVAYIDDTFYHYNKENINSLIHRSGSEVFKNRNKLYTAMKKFISLHSLDNNYISALNNRIVIDLIGMSNNIYGSKMSFMNKYKEEKRLLNNAIYDTAFSSFHFEYLPLRWKIFFKLCKKKQFFILSLFCILGEKLKQYLK